MQTATVKEKITNIQAQLDLIKKSFLRDISDRGDERVWASIKTSVKKIRTKIYQRHYAGKS